jgi:glyoxylase I family protein
MSIKHLDHLNLTVSNLEETIRWYGAVFGFEVVERGERESGPWAIIRGGESTLCVYEDASRASPDRFRQDGKARHVIYHFGFRITDREAWLERVRAHKLVLEFGGENRYPHSSSWYVVDPTGYSIEVVLWNRDEIRFDAVA